MLTPGVFAGFLCFNFIVSDPLSKLISHDGNRFKCCYVSDGLPRAFMDVFGCNVGDD